VGWLLVDDGNPFLRHPETCEFEADGKRTTATLHWSSVNRDTGLRQYWKRPYGEAGYGVRRSDASYWIAVQELTPLAQPVIDAVRTQQTAIRAASYVVAPIGPGRCSTVPHQTGYDVRRARPCSAGADRGTSQCVHLRTPPVASGPTPVRRDCEAASPKRILALKVLQARIAP
jgi:hypothetical protein